MKAIVGIDPGLTTGLCFFRDGEFVDGEEAMTTEDIGDYIALRNPDLVVAEDYIVGKRPSRPKEPLMVLGAVAFICGDRDIPLVIQSPSVLSFMKGKAVGHHKSKHVQSACSHVLYYLKKAGR